MSACEWDEWSAHDQPRAPMLTRAWRWVRARIREIGQPPGVVAAMRLGIPKDEAAAIIAREFGQSRPTSGWSPKGSYDFDDRTLVPRARYMYNLAPHTGSAIVAISVSDARGAA